MARNSSGKPRARARRRAARSARRRRRRPRRAGRPSRRAARRRGSSRPRRRPACRSGRGARARRACGSRGHGFGALGEAEHGAGDHEPLDLARALVDLRDLRVAEVALDRELGRVAVAAEDLDRLAGLPPRDARREELRLRAGLAVRLAAGRAATPRAARAAAPRRSRSPCPRACTGWRRTRRSACRTAAARARRRAPRRTRPGRCRPPARRSRCGRRRASPWRSLKPLPSSPSSRSAGTSTPSRTRSTVELEWRPELRVLLRDLEAVGARRRRGSTRSRSRRGRRRGSCRRSCRS